MGSRIVFLDRDGTINVDTGYVFDPESVELISGAARAIGDLHEAGYNVVVVSNQSAIGRGMCAESEVIATNERIQELLVASGGKQGIEDFFYSPHAPGDPESTRKPSLGMLPQIRSRWQFEPTRCWMVGDKVSDVEFGIALGIPPEQCALVLTGAGSQQKPLLNASNIDLSAVGIFPSIAEVAQYIVSQVSE